MRTRKHKNTRIGRIAALVGLSRALWRRTEEVAVAESGRERDHHEHDEGAHDQHDDLQRGLGEGYFVERLRAQHLRHRHVDARALAAHTLWIGME